MKTFFRGVIGRFLLSGCVFLFGSIIVGLSSTSALGTSGMVYQGRLLNKDGVPISTEQFFRFSLWKSADLVPEDYDVNGDIEPSAPNFSGWSEITAVTPRADGAFQVVIGGEDESLSGIDLSEFKFLQVEVRPDEVSAFQLLDPTSDNGVDNSDRKAILPVPYAFESRYSDFSRTNGFILDANDTAQTGQVMLQFGGTLAKILAYDIDLSRFFLNDNLHIGGNLTLTGTINGVDIELLDAQAHVQNTDTGTTSSTFFLNQSGNGILLSTAGISATRTVTFDNANTVVVGTQNTQTLRNKTIDATENTLSNIFPASFALRTKTIQFVPEYPALIVPDGTNNMASLYRGFDAGNDRKYETLSTQEATPQDLTLKITLPIPDDFVAWKSNPLKITVKSELTDSLKNHLNLSMTDTTGYSFSIASDIVSSVAGTWEEKTFDITEGTFSPGKSAELDLQLVGSVGARFSVSNITLQYSAQ